MQNATSEIDLNMTEEFVSSLYNFELVENASPEFIAFYQSSFVFNAFLISSFGLFLLVILGGVAYKIVSKFLR